MSDFNSKFQIVRGLVEETIIRENIPAATGYESAPGDVVEVINDGGVPKIQLLTMPRLDNAADVYALAALLAQAKVAWVVDVGQRDIDYSGKYVGKSVVVRGPMVIETDKYNNSETFVPGTKVTVVAGIIRQDGVGGEYRQQFGEVLEVDAARGVLLITVSN